MQLVILPALLVGSGLKHLFIECEKLNSGFSRLYWSGVAFNGVLQVADAQALQGLLQQVIGHAKAFGCGLLSLARI